MTIKRSEIEVKSIDTNSVLASYSKFFEEYAAHKLKIKLANRGISNNLLPLSLTILTLFLLLNWLFASFIGALLVTVFFIIPLTLVIFPILNNSRWSKSFDVKLHDSIENSIEKAATATRLNTYRKVINKLKKSLPLKYSYELNDSTINISVASSNNKRKVSYLIRNIKFGYFSDTAAIFVTRRFPQNIFRIGLSDQEFTTSLIEKLRQENIPLSFDESWNSTKI